MCGSKNLLFFKLSSSAEVLLSEATYLIQNMTLFYGMLVQSGYPDEVGRYFKFLIKAGIVTLSCLCVVETLLSIAMNIK